ncbi:PAS domain S-box protein [bacterium]|nr:PAS domain S-box protein [bacterium]
MVITSARWSDRVHPEDRKAVYAELEKYFSGETPIYHSEHRVLAKDGTWKWILDRGKVVSLNPNGAPLRMVGTHVDITTLKQAEQQLQWQSTALNACADAILITDRYGKIKWANPAFTTLTGYSLAEALGKNPSELVKSGWQDAEFYRQLWRQILSGQVWRGELINCRKDGSFYYEEMTITPICNERDEVLHFIAIKKM